MRDAKSLREEILNRSGNTYILQRLSSGIAAPALLMHCPLFAFSERAVVTFPLVLLGAIVAFFFLRGVHGLVEGTADHSVRRNVRAGTLAAKALIALIPVTSVVVIVVPKLKALPLWIFLLVTGVAVLVTYFRRCKKYWAHVQSVA
jgi:hypothetical protein